MFFNCAKKLLVQPLKQIDVTFDKLLRPGCSVWVQNKNRRRKRNYSSASNCLNLLTCTAFVGAATGFVLDDQNNGFSHILRKILPVAYADSSNIQDNRKKFNFIADIVEKTSSGVVNLEVYDQRHIDPITGKQFSLGGGSGFIVQSDGLILTNAHIVHKPNVRVVVKLYNGDVAEGIVEAIDERGDLAIVRINRNKLPIMKFGDSDDLRPGEFVVAMGSPLTLVNSITSGVVSNPGRHSYELRLFDVNMTYIQTDAAVTFGNSGGPLLNLNGEVIGINVLKFTAGISFAIPINYAKQFLKNVEETRKGKYYDGIKVLMKNDHEKRKFLGITMLSLTTELLQTLRMHGTTVPSFVNHGILIWKVFRGSPADLEGIRPGDIITHINEQPTRTTDDVYQLLEKNNHLLIKLVRDGIEHLVKVKPKSN